MKNRNIYLIVLLVNCVFGYSQVNNSPAIVTKGTILQIHTKGIENIQSFQNLNPGISNFVLLHQIGEGNKANISQTNDAGLINANQSYTVQSGNTNELTVGQIGSGNLLLGFQMGYMTFEKANQGNHYGNLQGNGVGNAFAYGNLKTNNDLIGERNKLTISQQGENNGVIAVQQGSDNSISAKQNGQNNFLTVMQMGKENTVKDFKQENNSQDILFNSIVQIGNNLSFITEGASTASQSGNSFLQTGTNLSLKLNNDLLNAGGIQINQSGKDMVVQIEQSYFSFPMK